LPRSAWPFFAAAAAALLPAALHAAQPGPAHARLAETSIEEIAGDPALRSEAFALGRQVFAGACAGCHEPDMKGSAFLRTPNLAAFGIGAAEVEKVVRYGVGSGHPQALRPTGTGLMPAFEDVLGPAERKAVAIYVQAGGASPP